MHIFIYGPPGSGKSTLGRILARRLAMRSVDLDGAIESATGKLIRDIFAKEGEAAFRALERRELARVCGSAPSAVVALGGGCLLNPECRRMAESAGIVLFLDADAKLLEARVATAPGARPLLDTEAIAGSSRQSAAAPKPIARLLAERAEHYASFKRRVMLYDRDPEYNADRAQDALGIYRIAGLGEPYQVRVGEGVARSLGEMLKSLSPGGRTVVVGDTNTMPLYGEQVAESLGAAGLKVGLATLPAGEAHKNMASIGRLWLDFMRGGVERGDVVVALGGGVVGDMTGFASATWLRGVRWVGLPTTLLAMVDSSMGGKTGVDLPEGKNLVGAFHSPSLVLADTDTLATLPVVELRCGLAEVVKHAVIGDPDLLESLDRFAFCRDAPPDALCDSLRGADWLPRFVARAMAVKTRVIAEDPLEHGQRAALNFGHTIGHGIEHATSFRVRHGEAVAIGMVIEAGIAETMGMAAPGLAERLAEILRGLGLPVVVPPDCDINAVHTSMLLDKKRAGGRVRFALPTAIGSVRVGVTVEERVLRLALSGESL